MLVNEEKGNLECKPSLRVDSFEDWVGVRYSHREPTCANLAPIPLGNTPTAGLNQ